jgi:O-antigen/teichoic acid export membrane protein
LIRVPLIIFVSLNHMSDGLAYAYVFAAMGVLLLSLFLLKRSSIRWTKPTLFRSYLKFALPLSIIAIASAATNNLDKILIGYFDVPASVAYYSSAQTLLAMVGVVGTAVATLAFPSISRLHRDGNMQSIRDVTYAAERYISMIAIPVVTFFVVFPTEISVTFFGPQFAPGGDAMRYLAIAVGLILLNQVYVSQILGVNRPDVSAKITLGTFLVGVVLLLIFIPDRLFGVQMLGMSYSGAAIASVITSAVSFAAVRLVVKDLTGTVGNPRILRHILAGVMAAVVVITMSTVYHPSGFIALGIFAVVTVVAFFASLALLKEFTRADIDYFIDLVNPSKMLSYMGDEVKSKK